MLASSAYVSKYRNYNILVHPFYNKVVFFQLVGFKPDLNESIAMMKKSNKRKFMSMNLTLI